MCISVGLFVNMFVRLCVAVRKLLVSRLAQYDFKRYH